MSWEQLRSITAEARAYAAEDRKPPTACPNDGQPLETGPNGELHCPFDGWIWDGVS